MTPSARPFPLFLFPLLAGCALLLASCGKTEDPAPPKVAVKGMEVFVAKAPVAGVDASEARTALVIGVGDYKDTYFQSLEAPAGDARKIAEKLRVLGFEVTLKLNPARGEMLTLTDDFGASLARRQGVGLFYFSGHGCMKPDEADPNFLIPAGTRITGREDLPQEAVNAQRVANRMKEAGNRLNLVFLDACRSNTLPSRAKAGSGGLASMRGASGLMFFFATQPNEFALEARETRSSLFTDALLAHMDTPGLSFMDMMADVTAATETASLELTAGDTPFKQSPFMTGTLSGRFSFVPTSSPATPPLASAGKPETPPAPVPVPRVDPHPTPEDEEHMAEDSEGIWKSLELGRRETPVVASGPLDQPGLKKSVDITLQGGVRLTLQGIPAGTFTMGSPANEPRRGTDEKQVQVTVSRPFWMARTEFTQEQWSAVMEGNPSSFKAPALPVDSVTWTEAAACVAALNQKATLPPGWTWALPTEARWEYACRAGTTTAFSFGDTLKESQARFDGTFPYQNALPSSKPARPMPAGLCEGNAWGLLGMHGNVYEWCQDAWDGSSPFPGGRDPAGTTGKYRVIRGGSWNHGAVDCRSANRNGAMPEGRSNTLSFRVAVIPLLAP